MLWELVLLAAAISLAYYWWSRRRLYQLARELPCPCKSYPVVGMAYMLAGSAEDRMKTIQNLSEDVNKLGGLAGGWLGNKLFAFISDPEAIEVITRNCLDKDDFTLKFTRTIIGNGLLVAPVNIWQKRRKLVMPFFGLKNINRIVPLFDQKSSKMADLMRAELGGGEFSAWKYFSTYFFDTACEISAGYTINTQEEPDYSILRDMNEIAAMICERMVQPWLHPDCIYKRLPVYQRFQNAVQRVTAYFDEMIQQKRQELTTGLKDPKKNTDSWVDYAETLIQASGGLEKGFSDIEIREELITMTVASTDTSASGSSYTAVLLSRYPEVQDKVYQELEEVFGDSNRAVTLEDLSKLKYLEAVIKESLRLYPPAPIIVREVHSDVVLPSGVTLVDGSSVVISIWGAHRSRAYWGEDADEFRPQRFLDGPLQHPAQFIPFSHSLRGCVGPAYAMLSMKTALAHLVRRYRLLPPAACKDLRSPLSGELSVIMRPVDNFTMRVEKRKK